MLDVFFPYKEEVEFYSKFGCEFGCAFNKSLGTIQVSLHIKNKIWKKKKGVGMVERKRTGMKVEITVLGEKACYVERWRVRNELKWE